MNPFSWLAQLITDKKIKLTHRGALALIFITIAFVVDNTLGFSFHHIMNNKLDELKKVDLIIQSKDSDSLTKEYAYYLRNRIINRKSFADYFFGHNSSFASKSANTNNPQQIANKRDSIYNKFIFIFSSG